MVTKKEFLVVVYSINKIWHYITSYKVLIHIDYSIIQYLVNELVATGQVIRWLLLLQEFDVTILDKPGRENVVADFLSRIPHSENEVVPVDDSLPDEHLFAISTKSLWYVDIANYLVTCKFPPHFSPREHHKLVGLNKQYTWINGLLFCTNIDNRCIPKEDIFDILPTCHIEPCGGHFSTQWTAQHILTTSYYQPTLHKDCKHYVQHCDQ